MNLISRDELKTKLDNNDRFMLVFVLGEWFFRAKHIPGSVNMHDPEECLKSLAKDDEIVVHCSDEACFASRFAYDFLESNGFTKVRRYAGGISDWEAAGYPLEGELV
ncbi:MAG: rhodanese-like domain-containing protein [Candidatus Heimdallarchaeota archaeon]